MSLKTTGRMPIILKPEQAEEYEELDNIRKKGVHFMETRCRKLNTSVVEWSPMVTRSQDEIRY